MPNPTGLFMLADHIKLSLLERQRAISLNINPPPSQFAQISGLLESFCEGLETLEKTPPADTPDVAQLPRLRSQYNDLYQQFYGGNDALSSSTSQKTITQPNDPALSSDFERAQQHQQTNRAISHSSSLKRNNSKTSKSVRFRDKEEEEEDPNRTLLFPPKYTDDPSSSSSATATPAPAPDATESLSNDQLHTYHSSVLAEQDEQLDRLGDSIGRQRYLSMQIGDELEGQVALLDEVDRGVDRHQARLDGARRRLKSVGATARENWGLTTIIVLIVILVFLIILFK